MSGQRAYHEEVREVREPRAQFEWEQEDSGQFKAEQSYAVGAIEVAPGQEVWIQAAALDALATLQVVVDIPEEPPRFFDLLAGFASQAFFWTNGTGKRVFLTGNATYDGQPLATGEMGQARSAAVIGFGSVYLATQQPAGSGQHASAGRPHRGHDETLLMAVSAWPCPPDRVGP